jgi:hypothetical protein
VFYLLPTQSFVFPLNLLSFPVLYTTESSLISPSNMAASNCTVEDLILKAKPFKIAEFWATVIDLNTTCPEIMLNAARGIIGLEFAKILTTGRTDFIPRSLGPWNEYDAKIILGRLIDFKLPLLVLILQLPRAPLGYFIETFTVLHLVGNPSDPISSFMYTLSFCFSILKAVRIVYGRRWRQRPW